MCVCVCVCVCVCWCAHYFVRVRVRACVRALAQVAWLVDPHNSFCTLLVQRTIDAQASREVVHEISPVITRCDPALPGI